MSYSVEWITPIYDRTYGDVITAEGQRNLINPKGCYNAIDLNRIENNTKYVMEDMLARTIIKVPPSLAIKLNWSENDIPTKEDMGRIIGNIQLLMNVSNPEIKDNFDVIYESTQFTYSLANALEHNLEIMKNQPIPPTKKWILKINYGIIQEYGTARAYVGENETVHIQAVPYGEDASYMAFNHWSGNTDDLQYVGDVNSSPTTYTMQYHEYDDYEVELTAAFKTRIPRTLKLTGGVVYDDVGGSTRQFFAGDHILILANTATSGKRFYEWKGTQAGVDNLTGGPEPSTSWLVMPDCDVELTSVYINAGQHSVTVDGYIQGWYDYGEYVTISSDSPGSKYVFEYWSGDTAYLGSVTNSTFKMPDVNVSFWSNWKYIPEQFQLVVNNGSGSGIYDDDDRARIVANSPPTGYGFYNWTIDEGRGSIGDYEASSTYFYMTTSNAVITAHYRPLHTVTLNNYNNTGASKTMTVMEGNYFTVSGTEIVRDKALDYWVNNTTGETINLPYFSDPMGTTDLVYTAVYRDREIYTLTVNNGSGSGEYMERATVTIKANAPADGKRFSHWSTSYDVWSIDNAYASSTTIVIGYGDCSVTAVYEDIPETPVYTYYDLTVINGSGSGRYVQGTWVTCNGNQAPSGYEFSHWEENGSIVSYSKSYSVSVNKNRTLTAHYKIIPTFTVTLINGKLSNGATSGTFTRNSSPTIIMDPAPEGMKFLQWEILTGDNNDITQPLAETTTIRNLTHDIVARATYYVPNPEITYTLSVINKDGSVTTSTHAVGDKVNVHADEPDEGYKFYKWIGDTQYVIDRYATPTVVNMPARNITIQMEYRREGYTTMYHVLLYGGELLVETDPETGEEKWDIEGEFAEQDEVRIRAIDIPIGWKFNGWKNNDDNGKSMSTVNDLMAEETFIRVEDFDITLTRDVIEKDKYSISIIDGEISGSYYEGEPVPIYFNKEDTETNQYTFVRWSGDTSYLKLFDGGAPFDITVPGTPDEPQTIRMPSRNIEISATYTMLYSLTVNGEIHGYYNANDTINISAEEIDGKRFRYWKGNAEYIDNKYNPNIIVTMPNGSIAIEAVYHNINDNNSVGYGLTSLTNNDTINIEDITIISGTIDIGFIITDSAGHIYTVTEVVDNTIKIMQLTAVQGGDENG